MHKKYKAFLKNDLDFQLNKLHRTNAESDVRIKAG
jgi:hypothetical protein